MNLAMINELVLTTGTKSFIACGTVYIYCYAISPHAVTEASRTIQLLVLHRLLIRPSWQATVVLVWIQKELSCS